MKFITSDIPYLVGLIVSTILSLIFTISWTHWYITIPSWLVFIGFAYIFIYRIYQRANCSITVDDIIIEKSPKTYFMKYSDFADCLLSVRQFWTDILKVDPHIIYEALKDTEICIYDLDCITAGDNRYGAVCWPATKTISASSLCRKDMPIDELICLLLRHELSHIVLWYVSKDYDGDHHHQVFREKELGA